MLQHSLISSFSPTKEGGDPLNALPSYMVAADNHSIANNNQSFLESAAETIGNIPQFVGVSLLSGANQMYNILPTLGNYMGGDFELSDTADVIAGIDDDLGLYYQDHKESADVAGFILSSLVPGLGGVKLLNAGQVALRGAIGTGKFGKNMSSALGLLAPDRQKHLTKAISEITNSNSVSLITNKNTLLAMRAGLGQGVLEAAAFETATAITLSASPVLENQDLSDIAFNIAIGGLAFGVIGGVIDITKSTSILKSRVKDADKAAAPWTSINVLQKGATPSNSVLYNLEQADSLSKIPVGVLTPERKAFLERSAITKFRALQDRARADLGTLADGDQIIASMAYSQTAGRDFEAIMGDLLGATRISRLADDTAEETIVKSLTKKIKAGIASPKAVAELAKQRFKASYAEMWGEAKGNVLGGKPQHLALSDTLKKGQEMVVSPSGVKVGKVSYPNSTKGIFASKNKPVARGADFDVLTTSLAKSQARNIWALELESFTQAGKNFRAVTVKANDIPLLDKLYREFDPRHQVALKSGGFRKFTDAQELLDFIAAQKVSLANQMLKSKFGKGLSQEDIAAKLNMRSSRLSGQVSDDLAEDMFALQSYSREYTDDLVKRGLHKAEEGVIPVYKLPKTLKTSYDTKAYQDLDGNVLEGMAIITQQERIQSQKVQNIIGGYFGDDDIKFLELGMQDVMDANRVGAGAKFLSAASSNYGTLAAKTEYIGNLTTGIIQKRQEQLREALEPALYKLGQSQKATIEWSTLNAKLRSLPDNYVLNEAGDALEPAVVARYKQMLAEGKEATPPVLQNKDTPLEIPLVNDATRGMAAAHISSNGKRSVSVTELRTAQGYNNNRNPNVFYPTPVQPKDYPFFAIVKDNSITGTGHSKNIYASSQAELDRLISKVSDDPTLEVLTKGEAERYYKSIGQFDQTRTLNENYLDSAFARKGLDSPLFIPTDPTKITKDLLNWHLTQETSVVREMVSGKYERQFAELALKGEQFTNLATSQFNNLALVKHAESVVKNPYMDYIKTALGVKNYSNYPFWANANKMLDAKVSEMYDRATRVVESSKSVEELAKVNSLMKEYGYKGAAYDMEMDLLINHSAPKNVLQNFVQKANGILSTVVLRLDHLNAVNNVLSANILYGAEMSSVIRAISRGDNKAVGELAALRDIKVPGTDKLIPSPQKLLANAYKAFGKDSPDLAYFKDNRFVTSISDQYKWTLDNLTLTGSETAGELGSKLEKVRSALVKAADKGERWTGNRLAEEFNRFVAAHSMKQVTDIAVKNGLMKESTALSYINTFVNRTQGNYLAAQRPMLFQGAIGQSIGLFQTYQFNLMQQLLRYVGEGTAKDSMTLLGLQGTIFGMNGLPAFNAMNTHIIGTASGNDKHRDAYTTIYGAAGKEAGDWLMYGLASNMLLHPDLKTNLFVRGDINPRQVTLVPTDPASVPIVQATGKFFANLFNTVKNVTGGGDVTQAILQGLEHNSISRPLAGLAQVLQGLDNPNYSSFSTTKKGNVISSNDLLSLVNIGRLAGGKPMGEAIAINSAYRLKAYGLYDKDRRESLGKTIKTTMIGGGFPSQEQLDEFAIEYTKRGGKQQEFNQWALGLYQRANTSQANDLSRKLGSSEAASMQLIMGGAELRDFTNN